MTTDQELFQLIRETVELKMMREHLRQLTEELRKSIERANIQSSEKGR